MLAATSLLLAANDAAAAPRGVNLGSRQQREEAVKAIPFERLTQKEVRDKLWAVVSDPSIFRRMPEQTIECDPEMFVFLVRHPEVVVNIWQLMGVTDVALQRTAPLKFDAADGAGTTSSVELVYGSPSVHVFYADGYYEGSLLKRRLTGKCVVVLTSNYGQNEKQRPLVSCRMDVFLQVDNLGVDLLAKTLHPLVGKAADHNFAESAGFLGAISQAAETKTDRVLELTERLNKLDPAIRKAFVQMTTTVAQRYRQAAAQGRGGLQTADRAAAKPAGVLRTPPSRR